MQNNLIINEKRDIALHWLNQLEMWWRFNIETSETLTSDLHLLTIVLPLVLAWCVHRCQTLEPKSVFVSFCASMWGCLHLCMNGLWLGGCTCPSVYVCVSVLVCEWQRVLNMCWRSQRNSRALIRTSPRWQLVNSVLRKGVLYSCTKECKLVPMLSGHWEQIHMAHTHFILKYAMSVPLWCNFLKEKPAQITRPSRIVRECVWPQLGCVARITITNKRLSTDLNTSVGLFLKRTLPLFHSSGGRMVDNSMNWMRKQWSC